MELKVWCDGIQRVVCGASATTTCQDIVFALAHATAQTGRFILIEKWRNNERVLAPSDRPLASLAKWGEYANDVTFVMKRSGDVSIQSKLYKINSAINKKSDSELIQKRKVLINSLINSNQDKQHVDKGIPAMMTKSTELGVNHSATLPLRNKNEPFVRSISFHKPIDYSEASSQYSEEPKRNFVFSDKGKLSELKLESSSKSFQIYQEPLYSTLSKNRPPQPPPYKEAIVKSTLFNASGTAANSIANYASSSVNKGNNTSSHLPNGNRDTLLDNQVTNIKMNSHLTTDHSPNHQKSISSIHQETISLIDMQQQTIKSQERDISNIEQELNLVQRKLSENELFVKRHKEEMELLKQLWIEQEMLIEKLESEHMEEDLNKLIDDANQYDLEMKEVKQKLTNCENEVFKCREEICNLMNRIDDIFNGKSAFSQGPDDISLLEHLHTSIREKTEEIESQKCDLNALTASIEHLDKTIQEKTDIIDQLVIEIKDANVEGLSLQSSALYVEERDTSNGIQSNARVGSNRKIPVLPHELGSTVPTKKNPDGIWV